MKLYFSPGACSLSPHIVLLEAGLPFTTEQVDLGRKTTASGADYKAINHKGYVPALALDDGVLLTEGPAIVQYLADLVPEKQLAPAPGSLARHQMASLLNFIATELHKNYSPLFNPAASEEVKSYARATLRQRYPVVERLLEGRDYLTGSDFSVADAYLFTVTSWADYLRLDMSAWPNVQAYVRRVAARPAVQQAMRDEGLLH